MLKLSANLQFLWDLTVSRWAREVKLRERALACREPKQLEKALRSKMVFSRTVQQLGQTTSWTSMTPEFDWPCVFILDRLVGMMTVNWSDCLWSCSYWMLCRSLWQTNGWGLLCCFKGAVPQIIKINFWSFVVWHTCHFYNCSSAGFNDLLILCLLMTGCFVVKFDWCSPPDESFWKPDFLNAGWTFCNHPVLWFLMKFFQKL